MRLAELSRASGVPTATIKYYLREGLLSPGKRTGTQRARYGREHLHRLRLIRALLDLAGLSLNTIRGVLATLDSDETGLPRLLKAAHEPEPAPSPRDTDSQAVREVLALVRRQGWLVSPRNPALAAAADVLAELHRLGRHDFADRLDDYAAAADAAAASDVEALDRCAGTSEMAEALILGNLLGDTLLASLRRLAQTHRLRSRDLDARKAARALAG
ncbi:MerR family transcriptional regulator [Streptomyces glaucosporus]|uniref:MerR family transcriptional regulator n=1 Tax=Streptomyces glaucosporus TaxID=284044 RepID=A0ABP5VR18_9ACTN